MITFFRLKWKARRALRLTYFHIKYRYILFKRFLRKISTPVIQKSRPYISQVRQLIGLDVYIRSIIGPTPGGNHHWVEAFVPKYGYIPIKKENRNIPHRLLAKFYHELSLSGRIGKEEYLKFMQHHG